MTIPEEARKVALILRAQVQKPDKEDLFLVNQPEGGVSSGNFDFCTRFQRGFACPMGLHSKAISLCPSNSYGFGRLASDKEVMAFADWWDSLSLDEAKRAIDGIWRTEYR
mgnify:CR=1 FL=1